MTNFYFHFLMERHRALPRIIKKLRGQRKYNDAYQLNLIMERTNKKLMAEIPKNIDEEIYRLTNC